MREVSDNKVNMLLVNKADLLTREQRRAWARHFETEGLRAVFWSALAESSRLEAEEKVSEDGASSESGGKRGLVSEYFLPQGSEVENADIGGSDPEEEGQSDEEEEEEEEWHTCSEGEGEEAERGAFHNSSCLLTKDELLLMFQAVHTGSRCKEDQLTVGLVGETVTSVCGDKRLRLVNWRMFENEAANVQSSVFNP